MTLARGCLSLIALLAPALSACQTEDTSAGPHFVSVADGSGRLSAPSGQNKEHQYFIEFRSRYALSYGHSYVIFGRAGEAGEMVGPEVAGLHPASTSAVPYVLGHLVPVPAETGWSDGDLEEAYRSASWRVMVDEGQYKRTVAYIRKLQAESPVWDASVYNCNAFVADIARFMGYKTPGIWLRPQEFMTKLRVMNAGSNASILPASASTVR
jgi:hypothetical protein